MAKENRVVMYVHKNFGSKEALTIFFHDRQEGYPSAQDHCQGQPKSISALWPFTLCYILWKEADPIPKESGISTCSAVDILVL